MRGTIFDNLAKHAADAVSRRDVLRLLAGTVATGILSSLGVEKIAAAGTCPSCGTCMDCNLDSGVCQSTCSPCTTASLCNEANADPQYVKLQQYLIGLGFRRRDDPTTTIIYGTGINSSKHLSTKYTKTRVLSFSKPHYLDQVATLSFVKTDQNAIKSSAFVSQFGHLKYVAYVNDQNQVGTLPQAATSALIANKEFREYYAVLPHQQNSSVCPEICKAACEAIPNFSTDLLEEAVCAPLIAAGGWPFFACAISAKLAFGKINPLSSPCSQFCDKACLCNWLAGETSCGSPEHCCKSGEICCNDGTCKTPDLCCPTGYINCGPNCCPDTPDVACCPGLGCVPRTAGNGQCVKPKIVFASNRDGNYEIYTMEANGSNQTRLTFTNKFNLDPAWSPDGTKIAFTTYRYGSSEICVMNADGSNLVRLTSSPYQFLTTTFRYPSWSPDGTKLSYIGIYPRTAAGVTYYAPDVFVMNANGTAQTHIGYSGLNGYTSAKHPTWSFQGTRLAFGEDLNSQIYVINADGSGLVEVESGLNPSASPIADKLAFESGGIYTYENEVVTPIALGPNGAPDWSSDASKIVFASTRDGHSQIYLMNANGSNQTRLTNNSASDIQPNFVG